MRKLQRVPLKNHWRKEKKREGQEKDRAGEGKRSSPEAPVVSWAGGAGDSRAGVRYLMTNNGKNRDPDEGGDVTTKAMTQ